MKMKMKMKLIEVKMLVPEDAVEAVDDSLLDFLCFSLEGVLFSTGIRDATKEEIKNIEEDNKE